MFKNIPNERIIAMTSEENRWLQNIKKAFHESDNAFLSGIPEDRCLEELLKAIDTSKTLYLSLQDKKISIYNNRKKFVDFIHEDIPKPENGGLDLQLINSRTGKLERYNFGELLYEIRCMIHENENLNISEGANFHILLDWQDSNPKYQLEIDNGRVIFNGFSLWDRIRQFLSNFITYLEGITSLNKSGKASFSLEPPLGTIRPELKKPKS